MADQLRAFIAVELPESVRAGLARVQEALRAAARQSGAALSLPRPANIHLTLRFLGDVDAGLVPAIEAGLSRTLTGAGPVEVRVQGAGAFPSLSRPRVLWAGVTPSEQLTDLHGRIQRGLADLSLTAEDKPFKPHLTLARVKSSRGPALETALKPFFAETFGVFAAGELILYRSQLDPGGAIYTPLFHWRLSA